MPKKIVFSNQQIDELKSMIANNRTQSEIAEYFNTTDTVIRNICHENNIMTRRSKKQYTCCVCYESFEADRKSDICPQCKSTPSKCVICGKEFPKKHPYTQKTCSPKCRGIYRKESGIAKSIGQKMRETKFEKYGTLDPAEVAKAKNGGQLNTKICKMCGKEFIPETPWQVYCKDKHYGPCPVCGNPTEIKDYSIGPQACSEECRMARINATCLERYGNKDAVNSEHAKQLGKQTSLKKYGTEYYMQSEEGKENFKKRSLEKYGTEHPMQSKQVQDKVKQTNLERYNAEHYMKTQEGKDKVRAKVDELYGGFALDRSSSLRKNYEETMMEKYGVIYPMDNPELVQKMKSNNLEKYGTEWAATTDEVNERRKQTCLDKYGVDNPWKDPKVRKTIEKTMTEKYGGPNVMCDLEMVKLASQRQQEAMLKKYGARSSFQVPEIRKKISATIRERYGVDWYIQSPECMKNNYHAISSNNREFAACLSDLGVESSFEYYIGRPSFDIKIKDKDILIEIDPTWDHNSYQTIWDDPKPKDYHLKKSQLAEENGFRCIHVFDWDNKEAILSMLIPKNRIFARKCSIQKIDRNTAEQFTSTYHLQGACRGQNIAYGLYYNGELVQMMSFGKARYNKNYDLELLRLCTRTGLEIVGGPSRLFKAFLKDYPDRSVLSYCDYSKFSGKVYTAIGMKLSHMTPPAKVWSQKDKYITDNYLRQLGYDKIFKANYGKGTSNEQLMLEHGWLPVYDCGQKVFIYEPEDS